MDVVERRRSAEGHLILDREDHDRPGKDKAGQLFVW
jgi:hypothetical protein